MDERVNMTKKARSVDHEASVFMRVTGCGVWSSGSLWWFRMWLLRLGDEIWFPSLCIHGLIAMIRVMR